MGTLRIVARSGHRRVEFFATVSRAARILVAVISCGNPGKLGYPGMREQTVEITHREDFSASHRLHNERWSQAKNRRIYGVCNNLHGHNYEVHVTVRGPVDPESGMVMNLTDLMGAMRELLIDRVDHRSLDSDVPFLHGRVTTAENIAIAFWTELEPTIRKYQGCRLHRIRLYESQSNYTDYLGADSLS